MCEKNYCNRRFYIGENTSLCFCIYKAANDVSQQSELCIFRCVASAVHFLFLGGKKMSTENTRICPECGNTIQPNDSFCSNCGFSSLEENVVTEKKKHIKKWPFFLGGGLLAIIATLVIVLFVVCFHDWEPATCTTPATCTKCGAIDGEPIEHDWSPATCTTVKTCKDCGETEGDTIEHKWVDATCTVPKTCSECKTTTGEPLGHTVDEWKTVKASTCTVKGKDEGVCTVCNETVSKEAELKSHTSGKWEVTKEATATTQGEKSVKCTVCGEVLKTESFTLTPEQIEKNYKAKCNTYSYNEIARNPDSYKGKYAKIYGKVIQVMQEKSNGKIEYTLRVGTSGSYYYDDVVLVYYEADSSESRILEDDMVTLYGELRGEYSYETVMGNEITIPLIYAKYVD